MVSDLPCGRQSHSVIMKEYKKTYWPLIAWCVALVPVMLGTISAAECMKLSDAALVALMMASVILMLLVLFWMIWKGEYVYWINGGPSFEQAKAAGSEARRDYARRHFRAMFRGSAIVLTLLAVECFFGGHELVMVLSVGAGIIAAAISILRIKWTVNEDDPKN